MSENKWYYHVRIRAGVPLTNRLSGWVILPGSPTRVSDTTSLSDGAEPLRTSVPPHHRPPVTTPLRVGARAGASLLTVAVLAWATGEPFVFPSLGPTAYALAATESAPDRGDVLAAHVVGALCGYGAHLAFATSLSLSAVTQGVGFSTPVFLLGIAGCVAVAATAAGMRALGTVHPPAAATTLIVALGILASVEALLVVVLAVVVLLATDLGSRRVSRALPPTFF